MELNEQIKQNTPTSENQEERKKPSETLPDEDLDQVSGGVRDLIDCKAASTKSLWRER